MVDKPKPVPSDELLSDQRPFYLQQTKPLAINAALETNIALPLRGQSIVTEQGDVIVTEDGLNLTDEADAILLRPLPSIKLDAILTIEGKTPDGSLIESVGAPWLRILDLIERDPEEIYRIDPRQWEEIIAGAYKEAGFDEVILTPRSGDLGRDVIATRTGMFSVRIIDQVKAYGPDKLVTADDVRSVHGVLAADVGVTKAVISTTSDFAPKLREDRLMAPLMPHRLELHPKAVLLPWLMSLRRKRG
jgi:restriction system protein